MIDGKTYFFSRDKTMYGALKTGKFEIDGQYRIFNEYLQTGLFEYAGNKYYADQDGNIQLGFQKYNGKTYFFSRDNTKYGVMRTGIFQIGDYYYCFDDITGEMKQGLFEYNGHKYYANENGELQFGYQTIDGKTYFFSRDKTMYGALKTGKFEIDGQYRIFNEYLQTGLFEYAGNKYYADKDGNIQPGFQTINGKKYFFSGDATRYGVMRYGWIQYHQYRYYLDADGTVVTGYKNIDGRDYMFDDQGRMDTGFVTINGNTYY